MDWLAFLRRHSIAYVEDGPSTAKNNVYIECPWCRDGKFYMGLRTDATFWGCWKSERHRGRKPLRLIREVLNCSWERAREEIEDDSVGYADLRAKFNTAMTRTGRITSMEAVEFPKDFKTFRGASRPPQSYYMKYMERRGFDYKSLDWYDLRWADSGEYEGRVIVPFYMDEKLVGWTGRAISRRNTLRYLTYPEGSVAKNVLFNHDEAAEGGALLVLTEGPLDALKVDWYGRRRGVRSVAALGLDFSPIRIGRIGALMDRFDALGILLDRGATARALDLSSRLSHWAPRVLRLPEGRKDPAELSPREVRALSKP